MYRSLAIRLLAVLVMFAATAPIVAAQRGSHGGFHGGAGVSVFRGAPALRNAPGSTFIARPVGPVAPFVSSPVAPFSTSPFSSPVRIGPLGFGRFPHGVGRFPRTIVVPPVIGFGYYSPYIWPAPAYAAPPYYGSYDQGYVSPAASAPAA